MGRAMSARLYAVHPDIVIDCIDPTPASPDHGSWYPDPAAYQQAGLSPDLMILSVKPAMASSVLQALQAQGYTAPVLSIAAGCELAELQNHYSGGAVMRYMPNLGLISGQAAGGLYTGQGGDDEVLAGVIRLLSCFGPVTVLNDERQMHILTALSGSGPAYYFEVCRLMAEAAQSLGMEKDAAEILAKQTLVSAAAMFEQQPDISCEEWCRRIAVPGGTTEAGLNGLGGEGQLRQRIRACLQQADARSQELAKL